LHRVLHFSCDPKICELHLAFGVHQNVGRLYVLFVQTHQAIVV
jgi:hypothetical protein